MSRILRLWIVGLIGAGVLGSGRADAHFLFIKIGPVAEAGRSAEVYFSEQAEAGDPQFIDKVAHTQLWIQESPGRFEPLRVQKAADRLRAFVPSSGSVAVVGVCQYGVLARPNQTPFLLRYYPKALAGRPDELNKLTPRSEIPFEIQAAFQDGHVRLLALRQGQPIPRAVFHTVDSDLNNSEVTAGADGSATWTPPAPGRYSIYVKDVRAEEGTEGGKRFEEIREFATVSFAWPLERRGADPEAVALFEQALATRALWRSFPGFSAQVSGQINGRPFDGKVTVQADGKVEVQTDDPVAQPWLEERLESMVMHRLERAENGSDSSKSSQAHRPVLHFGDDQEDHPLGRLLIFEGGRFASSYRVRDRQITVVNRRIGRQSMTINVLDNERNPEGHYLPHSYLVHYWDAATGTLNQTETVQERWRRLDSWDLPARQTVSIASSTGFSVSSVTFSEQKLLGGR